MRFESAIDRRRRWDRAEQKEAEEIEAVRAMLEDGPPFPSINYGPGFLRRDDHDGYLVKRSEVGPDPYDYDWPRRRVRPPRRVRKRKRPSTARDRLAQVEPSVRINPTGPRSAELVITRRMHEVKTGLKEALDLARMIEGAIKYRNPPQPNRKLSWRQQLHSSVLYRPGLLTWLVRNPMNCGELGAGRQEPGAGSQEPGLFGTTTQAAQPRTAPGSAPFLTVGVPPCRSAPAPDSRLPAPSLAALPIRSTKV